MDKEKCKICGMETSHTIYIDDNKTETCCDVCHGKYGGKYIYKALEIGDYGKTKVILHR